jgi:hypothetical protein
MVTVKVNYSDYESPDLPGSGRRMKVSILKLHARLIWKGIRCGINSGYRTRAHNATLKFASPNSAHLRGHALDIQFYNDTDMMRALYEAKYLGIRRVIIYNRMIHFDTDESLPAVWTFNTRVARKEFLALALPLLKRVNN